MDDLYQEELLDHYKNPHNFRTIQNPTCKVSETNASCGDALTLELNVEMIAGKQTVTDAAFQGIGCAVSVAATSKLTDYVRGKTIEELQAIDFDFMQNLLGATISPGRVKCLTLSARALIHALETALKNQ